jgi:hypothetical protein
MTEAAGAHESLTVITFYIKDNFVTFRIVMTVTPVGNNSRYNGMAEH